jgi:hypothetical protein
MPSQEQTLQLTLLDLLVDPEAGNTFEADPAAFGQARGVHPPHDAALHRFKDRLQIYRQATRNGTRDLLENFFPVTQALLETAEAWDDCVEDFIASRSITTPYYRDIIPGFVGWLSVMAWGQAQWPSLLAVAHFELLEFLVERWPDATKPTALKDHPSPGDRVLLDPATRVVQYTYAVHLATPDNPIPEAKPVHLLAYRDHEGAFQVLELTESTAALLVKGQEVSIAEATSALGVADLAGALGLVQDLSAKGVLWGFVPSLGSEPA